MKNLIRKIALTVFVLVALYRVTSSQTSADGTVSLKPGYEKNKINKKFELYQNVPEVFKDVTVIKFDIYSESYVILDVYDQDGNKVESLVEGEIEPGEYNVYFKASKDLTSGTYKYKIDVDGSSQIREMIFAEH